MLSSPGQLTHDHVLSFQYSDWLVQTHSSAPLGRVASVGQAWQASAFRFRRRLAERLQ
jgi:hypothetical protein